MQDEDKKLIRKALKGNKKSFSKLIEIHDKKLYGFILRIIKDEHIAQDILQDTFIQIYKNLSKFHLDKPFLPWAFTIAHNTAINYLNKIQKNSPYRLKDDIDSYKQSIISCKSTNPEDIYINRELNLQLSDTINKLPKKYKDLIILKYFEGLTYTQISERLNLSIQKVESRLYMARQKLIKCLAKSELNKNPREGDIIGLQEHT